MDPKTLLQAHRTNAIATQAQAEAIAVLIRQIPGNIMRRLAQGEWINATVRSSESSQKITLEIEGQRHTVTQTSRPLPPDNQQWLLRLPPSAEISKTMPQPSLQASSMNVHSTVDVSTTQPEASVVRDVVIQLLTARQATSMGYVAASPAQVGAISTSQATVQTATSIADQRVDGALVRAELLNNTRLPAVVVQQMRQVISGRPVVASLPSASGAANSTSTTLLPDSFSAGLLSAGSLSNRSLHVKSASQSSNSAIPSTATSSSSLSPSLSSSLAPSASIFASSMNDASIRSVAPSQGRTIPSATSSITPTIQTNVSTLPSTGVSTVFSLPLMASSAALYSASTQAISIQPGVALLSGPSIAQTASLFSPSLAAPSPSVLLPPAGSLAASPAGATPSAVGSLAAAPAGATPSAVGSLAASPAGATTPSAMGSLAASPAGATPSAMGSLTASPAGATPSAMGSLTASPAGATPSAVGSLAASPAGAIPSAMGSLAASPAGATLSTHMLYGMPRSPSGAPKSLSAALTQQNIAAQSNPITRTSPHQTMSKASGLTKYHISQYQRQLNHSQTVQASVSSALSMRSLSLGQSLALQVYPLAKLPQSLSAHAVMGKTQGVDAQGRTLVSTERGQFALSLPKPLMPNLPIALVEQEFALPATNTHRFVALEKLFQVLPVEEARSVVQSMPKTNTTMATGLLFFLLNLRLNGGLQGWLGTALFQQVNRVAPRAAVAAADDEMKAASPTRVSVDAPGSWQSMIMPLQLQGEVIKLTLYWRERQKNKQDQERNIFAIEGYHHHMGRFRLDGQFMHKRLTIHVSSDRFLPAAMSNTVQDIFSQQLSRFNLVGHIQFLRLGNRTLWMDTSGQASEQRGIAV